MSVPSIKTIKSKLTELDETEVGPAWAATLTRRAIQWAEGTLPRKGNAASIFKLYYLDEVWENNRELSDDLDDYRSYAARIRIALMIINTVLEAHGVEHIGSNQDTPGHFRGLEYVNMGDLYTPTVIFDYGTGTWKITSGGDLVEAHPQRFGELNERRWTRKAR